MTAADQIGATEKVVLDRVDAAADPVGLAEAVTAAFVAAPCPECGGRRMADDRPSLDRLLRFDHRLDCSLGMAEDATLAADHERMRPGRTFHRPVTPAELTLPLHQGFPASADTVVHITHYTPGVRLRRWSLT